MNTPRIDQEGKIIIDAATPPESIVNEELTKKLREVKDESLLKPRRKSYHCHF